MGCVTRNIKKNLNALWVVQTAIQKKFKYISGCTTRNITKILNALWVVQTAIHLEKFILTISTTRNVKGAEKIIAGCIIRNDNIF